MIPLRKPALLLIALAASLTLRPTVHSASAPPSRLARLPRISLWAWERREDLRTADPNTFAIAYLDQTLTLGPAFRAQPRRDPIAFPASASRIPVIRMEAPRNTPLDASQRDQAIEAILKTAHEPRISALQLDFDATRSQRPFYRDLLTRLRPQLPASLPLSITALASWCADDDWISTLPIDEAVPMFFRMEPFRMEPYRTPRARPTRADRQARIDAFPIREPLCQSSLGLSTNEPWPSSLAGKRIYLFPDHGWQREIPIELARRVE